MESQIQSHRIGQMNTIELKNITYQRDGKDILSGISWNIAPGENWAMVGPNGSGKTTLLSIVAGYNWPTEGLVQVLGRNFGETNLPELRKAIGWVSSAFRERLPERDIALDIVLSGIDASVGIYRDYAKKDVKRAQRALDHLGVSHLESRTYGTLSQGEQQRVLIARSLVNNPKLIILDEPCIGLDPQATESFLDDLSRLASRQNSPAIVFVTHRIEEIRPFVNRAIVLKKGKILAVGELKASLNSKVLSEAFDCRCVVSRRNSRYYLNIVK